MGKRPDKEFVEILCVEMRSNLGFCLDRDRNDRITKVWVNSCRSGWSEIAILSRVARAKQRALANWRGTGISHDVSDLEVH